MMPSEPANRRAAAVGGWAGVQCAALGAAAGGVHLWPHQPGAAASLALAELVGTQVVVAGLIFPVLLANAQVVLVSSMLLFAFDAAAGVLSAAPAAVVGRVAMWGLVWVVGLAGWARAARRPTGRSYLVSTAVVLALGSTILFYGRAESAAAVEGVLPDPARFGPLLGGINVALGGTGSPLGWMLTGLPLLSTATAWVCRKTRSIRPVTP